jgi:hypothetical protein
MAIEALAKYGNVTDAARVAGVSDTTFYRHLNKDPEFARLCDASRAKAARPLEMLAWQRAVEGAPETIIRKGEVVQIKVKPSDSMMRLMLQASNPKKYGRLSRGGPSRRQVEKKLRKTIEAEVRESMRLEMVASDEEVFESLCGALRVHGIRVREALAEEEAAARAGGDGSGGTAGNGPPGPEPAGPEPA